MMTGRRAGSVAVACGSLWLTAACATTVGPVESVAQLAPRIEAAAETIDTPTAAERLASGSREPEAVEPAAPGARLPSGITCVPDRQARVTCHERIDVAAADASSFLRPLDSSSMTSEDLRVLGPDTAAWIAFTRAAAGSLSGSERIYVDGMPATADVPASAIGRITVNGDPFTAEYADVGEVRVDIDLLPPDRRWRFSLSPPSVGAGGGSPLSDTGAPVSRSTAVGLSGPVPRLPITFSLNATQRSHVRRPLFIDAGSAMLTTSADDVRTTSRNAALVAGAVLVTRDIVVRATFSGTGMRAGHAGIGGINAASTGQSVDSQSRSFQTTWKIARAGRLHRGGFSLHRDRLDAVADSIEPFVVVTGRLAAGGDETASETRRTAALTAKHVIDGGSGTWKAGIAGSHATVAHVRVANPLGRFQREDISAATGTWTVTTGPVAAAARATSAAAFAERLIVQGTRASLRAGLRIDWQDGAGLIASPRVVGAARAGGFHVSGGAGLFVRAWTPELFAVAAARDGTSGSTFVMHDVSVGATTGLDPSGGDRLRALIGGSFERRRDLVARAGIQRRFGPLRAGIEHTWTHGTSLPGTVRERESEGLVDVIRSDRRLRRHETHVSLSARRAAASLNAHYRHTWSFDDGELPLAIPARAGDVGGEWARSAGVPRHAAGMTASLALPFRVRMLISAETRSGTPYNILSGRDPDRLAAFTDRAGLPRNAGLLPPFGKLSVSASRTVRVPDVAWLAFDVGVRADNLTDRRNITSMGHVLDTPAFGMPLDAMPGRSIRVWAALAR